MIGAGPSRPRQNGRRDDAPPSRFPTIAKNKQEQFQGKESKMKTSKTKVASPDNQRAKFYMRCSKCAVWKTLANDKRYRTLVRTCTIGGRKTVDFLFDARTNELEIQLPERTAPSRVYPRRFNEDEFTVMCSRFYAVTRLRAAPPSTFRGNRQGQWPAPREIFRSPLFNAPYVVAVVRKIIEDHAPLDNSDVCTNQG